MTHQFKSTIDVQTTRGNMVIDWEDDLVVEYDYAPAEPQTLTYPGCTASVELTRVINSQGDDILDGLRDRDMCRLIGEAWEDVARRDELDAALLDRVLGAAAEFDADKAAAELEEAAMSEINRTCIES